MNYKNAARKKLIEHAKKISENRNSTPVSKVVAFRKLFIQEKRDWKNDGIQVGWKRGEIFEVIEAVFTAQDWKSEWGDMGYYIAQSWNWLWWLYALITPLTIIAKAEKKFSNRAKG